MENLVQIVTLPLIPVRKEPSDKSEMVTQLLFGERVEVCDSTGMWLWIRSLEDGYTGWIDRRMMAGVCQSGFRDDGRPVYRVFTPFACLESDEDTCYLPMGSILREYDPERRILTIGKKIYAVVAGTVKPITGVAGAEAVLSLVTALLNAPYLWGGRSCMGIDCSGLVQLTYGLCGIVLPRDACDQAACGTAVTEMEVATRGDLVFFENAEGRITHVGIYRGDHTILHASGTVHTDGLDDKGIFSANTGAYTHRLHSIRRLF